MKIVVQTKISYNYLRKVGIFTRIPQVISGRNETFIIPCHRVIAANAELGGYVYGLEMKK